MLDTESGPAFIDGAIYRFTRTDNLRFYRAARTKSGIDFIYPIQVGGTRIADESAQGRRYVIIYLTTKWGKLAAWGYWLDPKEAFKQSYVTDATPAHLELVASTLAELPDAAGELDNVLNRDEIELDMEIWGVI